MSKHERCKSGGHIWVRALDGQYEICQMCKEPRKIETHVLPEVTKKEARNEPMGETEDRSQPAPSGEGGNMDGQKTPTSDPARL